MKSFFESLHRREQAAALDELPAAPPGFALDAYPPEILHRIITMLDRKPLCRFMCTSHYWNSFCSDGALSFSPPSAWPQPPTAGRSFSPFSLSSESGDHFLQNFCFLSR